MRHALIGYAVGVASCLGVAVWLAYQPAARWYR